MLDHITSLTRGQLTLTGFDLLSQYGQWLVHLIFSLLHCDPVVLLSVQLAAFLMM